MDIDKKQPNAEQAKMAYEEEMVDMLKKHKLEKSFKPQRFRGKTTENDDFKNLISTIIANSLI